ncbi:MAG: hypothetical protein LBT59_02965 [Clostridiales bacterium]|jgi:hypothetical protein|nr:hypothetical protein [Clostridiales bacterium]
MNGQDDFNWETPPPQTPDGASGPLSRKDWIITMALLAIPCIGIIFSLSWAFSEGNPDRKKFARAWLIFNPGLYIVLTIIAAITSFSVLQ